MSTYNLRNRTINKDQGNLGSLFIKEGNSDAKEHNLIKNKDFKEKDAKKLENRVVSPPINPRYQKMKSD